MKKISLVFSISLYFLVGINVLGSINAQPNNFSLTGMTNNIPDSTMIYLLDEHNEQIDSTLIINNQFNFSGTVQTYKEVYMTAQYDGKFEYGFTYLEPGEIIFDASKSAFMDAKISGSVLQAQTDELMSLTKPWRNKERAVSQKIYKIYDTNGDTTEMAQLKMESTKYMKKEQEITKQFIKTHPSYLISLKSLTFLKNSLTKNEVETLYSALSPSLQNSKDGESIKLG